MCVPFVFFFVQLNTPSRDHTFCFTGCFVADPATHFAKKKSGACCRHAKKHENTTVLNKQKRTVCLFKVALFEALLSVDKIPSMIQRHRGARSLFLRLVTQKRYPSKLGHFLFSFLASHRTNMSRERIFVVTERCIFFGRKKKAATHIPGTIAAKIITYLFLKTASKCNVTAKLSMKTSSNVM